MKQNDYYSAAERIVSGMLALFALLDMKAAWSEIEQISYRVDGNSDGKILLDEFIQFAESE